MFDMLLSLIFKRTFKVLAHFELKVHIFVMLEFMELDRQNAAVWNGLTNKHTTGC